jgi:predicted neutral ceramidase superfamily lipid hydrolase
MPTIAEKTAIIAAGIFFMTGLITGVWKYMAIMKSSKHQAPVYVDIAHRASLLYAFACLVLLEFIKWSTLSDCIESIATGMPVMFFAIAIGTYILLGITNHTDNQFKERNFITTTGMYLLIAGEVGGFGVLLVSGLKNLLGM